MSLTGLKKQYNKVSQVSSNNRGIVFLKTLAKYCWTCFIFYFNLSSPSILPPSLFNPLPPSSSSAVYDWEDWKRWRYSIGRWLQGAGEGEQSEREKIASTCALATLSSFIVTSIAHILCTYTIISYPMCVVRYTHWVLTITDSIATTCIIICRLTNAESSVCVCECVWFTY